MTESPTPPFGRLERADLRDAWPREDTHFTPWLAEEENLRLLGETIGLDLELVGREQGVGPFSADLFCKVVGEDTNVLIENQIERTDHTHLGQVLTYAAGLDAVTIVWIAKRFTEEHRAALDWLNEVSRDGIQFFGLEVELWRIGNSPVAPKFNVVAKPNDWSRNVRGVVSGADASGRQAMYRSFWTEFLEALAVAGSPIPSQRSPGTEAWMSWGIGYSGFGLMGRVGFRDGYLDAALVTYDHDLHQAMESRKAALPEDLQAQLIWDFAEGRRQNYARIRREGVDPMDRATWPDSILWLRKQLEELLRAFTPILDSIARSPVDGQ